MLNRLLPVLFVNLVAVSGYAADVCSTLAECQQLKTQLAASLLAVNARIRALQPSPQPQIGDFARHNDGSIRHMTQVTAIGYCKFKGQHLPTVRELAQWAQSMGATGISETAQNGYSGLTARNDDGDKDNFYFSRTGYKRPNEVWSSSTDTYFWSSSVSSNDSDFAFFLDGNYGTINYISRTAQMPVRCARGQ
ncbi:MAG: hypothetical protein ACK5WZ_03980 [Pseudobdellovibrionaceae bacterium]